MSKKSKRRQTRKKRKQTQSAQSSAVQEAGATPQTTAAVQPRTRISRTGTISYGNGFDPDYSQTIKDLKRIGILAGSFFVLLIGLAIFLN